MAQAGTSPFAAAAPPNAGGEPTRTSGGAEGFAQSPPGLGPTSNVPPGRAQGSPARLRAYMGPLPDIRVVVEQWDLQGMMREIAKLKAEMHVLAGYTTEMA